MTLASFPRAFRFTLLLLCLLMTSPPILADDGEAQPASPQSGPPEIADEPKTVDPATLVPEQLAVSVTVNFTESSLREIAKWIESEQ